MGDNPTIWCRSNSAFSNLPASGHCHWLCHLARAVDEKLRRRRQCAVLQCDNANRSTRREVDWQNFDGAFPATKSQNGFRSHREKVPLRDKSDPCNTGGRDHDRAGKLKSHRRNTSVSNSWAWSSGGGSAQGSLIRSASLIRRRRAQGFLIPAMTKTESVKRSS